MSATWTRTYDMGQLEFCTGAIGLNGNLLLSGHTQTADYLTGDMAVLCVSTSGDSLWTRYYGSAGVQCSDALCNYSGGFVVAGFSQLNSQSLRRAMIVRCDAAGDTIWTRYHESDSTSFQALGLIELANHDILVLGFELYDTAAQYGWICRMTGSGDVVWSRRINQRGWDTFVDAVELPDGSILAGGTAQEPPMYNFWTADMLLVHITSNGEELESHTYGGNRRERFYSLDRHSGGRMIAAGYYESQGDELGDAYLVCTDASGGFLWSNTYGDQGMDHMHDCIALNDGTIFMSGHTEMMGGAQGGGDFYSVRTDGEGNELEAGFFGGAGWDNSESVVQIGDMVFSAGYSYAFSPTIDFSAVAYTITAQSQGPERVEIVQGFDLFTYPNPFNQAATISFELAKPTVLKVLAFDINGRLVSTLADGMFTAGHHTTMFDGARLASGTYIVQLQSEEETQSLKTVLLK